MRGPGRLPLRPRLPGLKGPRAPHAIASPSGHVFPTPSGTAGDEMSPARRPQAPRRHRQAQPAAAPAGPSPPRPPVGPALVSGGTLCLGVSLPRLGSARPGGLPAASCSPRCCAWAAGPGLPLRAGSACSCGRCWAAARPRRGAAAGRSGRCTAQVTTPGPRGVARPGIPTAPHWPPSPRPIHRPWQRARVGSLALPSAGRPGRGLGAGLHLTGCWLVPLALPSLFYFLLSIV